MNTRRLLMYIDDPVMREILGRLVQSITSNPVLWDDLLQEALIHVWITEACRPSQTRSWYLQSCKFHLLHYLSSGRSIDSIKRRDARVGLDEETEQASELFELADPSAAFLSSVCARELVELLARQLLPKERAVLHCLADGLGTREIGRKLNISHTMVMRHRCKIASLLNRLEKASYPGAPPKYSPKLQPAAEEPPRGAASKLFPDRSIRSEAETSAELVAV